jgi:hypothetical protein
VLTYVYEQIICGGDGSKLTLLDLMALLTAIPATIGGKLITGRNLFTDAQLAAVTVARTWDELLQALSGPQALDGPGKRTGAPDPNHVTAGTLSYVGALSRGLSWVFYCVRELAKNTPAVKDIFNYLKIASDMLTYAMAMVSAYLLRPAREMSTRQTIDFCTVLVSVTWPLRDLYIVERKLKGDPDVTEKEDILRGLETLFGIGVLGCTIWSLVLQSKEPTPPGINPGPWTALVVTKGMQNICSGLYSAGAFTGISFLNIPPSNLKRYGAIARAVILGFRFLANDARASKQLVFAATDYDGPL